MANGTGNETDGWMSDVQRALALLLIGILVASTMTLTMRLVWSADIAAVVDLVKIMLAALVNMGLIALGFFFGNTSAKMQSDAGQQKVVDKLTSSTPPATGPVAPVAGPTVVVAWFSLLTDAEKSALAAAAPADPRVAAFIEAAKIGKAVADDLTYLAGKGLLTAERAAQLKDA